VENPPAQLNACPMKCLPNEMRSLFHRGEAYFIGAKPISSGRSLFHRGVAYLTGVVKKILYIQLEDYQ